MKEDIDQIRQVERDKYSKWYYEHEYWKEDDPKKKNDRYQYDDVGHNRRFEFLTQILLDNFEFSTFLDVGCGMGHMIRSLVQKGKDGKGIEVSVDALTHFLNDLVSEGRVFLAGAEDLPFKDKEFDLVCCFDVMEHLPLIDVDVAISELSRVSKKMLVLTINLDNPYEYHPSMFSRELWEQKFVANNLVLRRDIQEKIEKISKPFRPEYDFFVFEKK